MFSISSFYKDQLLKGSFLLFVGNGVASLSNYLFQFIMSRHLSVSDFGAMNSLLSLMVVSSVPAVAISLVTTKYVSIFKARNSIEQTVFFFGLAFKKIALYGIPVLFLMFFAIPAVSDFLRIQSPLAVFIMIIIIFLSFIMPLNAGVLQGLQRFFSLGTCIGMAGFLKLFFGFLFVKLGFMLNGAMAALLFSFIIVFLLSTFFLKDLWSAWPVLQKPDIEFRKMFSYTMPVVLSSLGLVALTHLDMVLVKHFFPSEQVGTYASVAVLGRTVFYLPGIIVMAMFPVVSERHALNENTFRTLKKALLLTIGLGGVGLGILVAVPDIMLSILFGKTYTNGASFLRVYALAMFFMAVNSILSKYLLAVEKMAFIVTLLVGCLIEIILICLFHDSLRTVIIILMTTTFVISVTLAFQTFRASLKTA